jgi:diguanylate cyclase (GGDEF)-like protein
MMSSAAPHASSVLRTVTGIPETGIGALAQDLLNLLEDRSLGQQTQATLSELIEFAALAEEQIARSNMRIQNLLGLTGIDSLTGLDNRQGLERAFLRLAAASGRYDEPSALVMLAIEGVNALRDHDHDAADILVRAQARALEHAVRRSDIIARTAPDEFIVLLPRCPLPNAKRKAQSLAHCLSSVRPFYKEHRLESQAHFGVAPFGPDSGLERTLAAALHALTRDLAR